MKPALEKQLMASLYLAQHFHRRQWFRFNEVVQLSGIKKPTLQRILPRLERRGWIQSWRGESFDPDEPAMAIFHLPAYKSQGKIRIKVPVEITDNYQSRVQKLKRKALRLSLDGTLTYHKEDQEYSDAIKEYRKKKDMPFRGKAEAWRKAVASALPRQHTFYSVLMFPFIYEALPTREFPFGRKMLVHYCSNYSSVPEGDKQMWYNAAKEVLNVLEKHSRANKIII